MGARSPGAGGRAFFLGGLASWGKGVRINCPPDGRIIRCSFLEQQGLLSGTNPDSDATFQPRRHPMPAHALYERHRPLLDDALQALSRRGHWSPFPEAPSPKVYGETAQAQGHAAVQ